jgi:ATP-dependent Lon protease
MAGAQGEIEVALLPCLDTVLFPGQVARLEVDRPSSLALIEQIVARPGAELAVVCQRDPVGEPPSASDLCRIGTTVKLLEVDRYAADKCEIRVEALARFEIVEVHATSTHLTARGWLRTSEGPRIADEPGALRIRRHAERLLPSSGGRHLDDDDDDGPRWPAALYAAMTVGQLTDLFAAMFVDDAPARQRVLETLDPTARIAPIEELVAEEQRRRAGFEDELGREVQLLVPLVESALDCVQRELGCSPAAAKRIFGNALAGRFAGPPTEAAALRRIRDDTLAQMQRTIGCEPELTGVKATVALLSLSG